MTTGMSKADQETRVGEGLALGLVALDVHEVNDSKMGIEFAFQRAWRAWPHRGVFPIVRADIHRNDLLRILHAAPRRRSAILSGWTKASWPFVPYVSEGWTLEDVAEIAESGTGVTLAGWIALAQAFVDELQRDPRPARHPQ